MIATPLTRRAAALRLAALPWLALPAAAALAQTPLGRIEASHSRAELFAARGDLRGGEPLWLALRITPRAGWHSYWKNPGDAGMPTRIVAAQWPPGWRLGPLQWPAPQRIPVRQLASYGYDGAVVLPFQLFAPRTLAPGHVRLPLRVEWLVCEDSCIAQDGELMLTLPAQGGAPRADHAGLGSGSPPARLIAAALARVPVDDAAVQAQAVRRDGRLQVTIAGLPPARGELFIETEAVVEPGPPPALERQGGRWLWSAPLGAQGPLLAAPAAIPAVWVPADGTRARRLHIRLLR
jgi:thiol:disulfide interchange protein DsbD